MILWPLIIQLLLKEKIESEVDNTGNEETIKESEICKKQAEKLMEDLKSLYAKGIVII